MRLSSAVLVVLVAVLLYRDPWASRCRQFDQPGGLSYEPRFPPLGNETFPEPKRVGVDFVTQNRYGCEDLEFMPDGKILSGASTGEVFLVDPETGEEELLFVSSGRPLAFKVDRTRNVIWMLDAYVGLVRWDQETGERSIVLSSVNDTPFRLANQLALDEENGVLYITDSTSRSRLHNFQRELVEMYPSGRLVRYEILSGQASEMLTDLWLANGVALSRDGSFLLVAELFAARLKKVWLSGEREGQVEHIPLPGVPDNLSNPSEKDGSFWVAMPLLRNDASLLLGSGLFRRLFDLLDIGTWPLPKPATGWAHVSEEGKLLEWYVTTDISDCTSAEPGPDGTLYLGSHAEPYIARVKR